MKTQENNNSRYNNLLDLCISGDKIKGIIQKEILDYTKDEDSKADFTTFVNSQVYDKVFTNKVAKFQNNLNLKTTQELIFNIGDDEQLEQKISFKRDPKSTLPQAERPYKFIIEDIKPKKEKTLEEEIEAFKKKIKAQFQADLSIKQK